MMSMLASIIHCSPWAVARNMISKCRQIVQYDFLHQKMRYNVEKVSICIDIVLFLF